MVVRTSSRAMKISLPTVTRVFWTKTCSKTNEMMKMKPSLMRTAMAAHQTTETKTVPHSWN